MFAEAGLGIGSAARTLKPLALASFSTKVDWVDVTYAEPGGILERMPLLPERFRGTLRGFVQTAQGLDRGPFDGQIFLTHNPAVLHPLAVRNTPTCLWTDATPVQIDAQAEEYEHSTTRNPVLRFLKRTMVRNTFHAARWCIGWSEWARRSFVADYGVPLERTLVIPPGIDLSLWPFVERPDHPGPVRLLFVGGNFRRKGGLLLLEIFRSTFGRRCELDIVTWEKVEPEPGVRVHRGLTSGSEALRNLYRSADVFVMPTLADCHSIASLEAMATGLPVITTRVGANAEIVEDGTSGLLVDREDRRLLAQALEALVTNVARARALGRRGRAIVEERFDAKDTIEHLLRLAGANGRDAR